MLHYVFPCCCNVPKELHYCFSSSKGGLNKSWTSCASTVKPLTFPLPHLLSGVQPNACCYSVQQIMEPTEPQTCFTRRRASQTIYF